MAYSDKKLNKYVRSKDFKKTKKLYKSTSNEDSKDLYILHAMDQIQPKKFDRFLYDHIKQLFDG